MHLYRLDNDGTVNVLRGKLRSTGFDVSSGVFNIPADAELELGVGETLAESSVVNVDGTLTVSGQIRMQGTVNGNGRIVGRVAPTAGHIRPGGDGIGVLTIEGDYEPNFGNLDIQLGGTQAGTEYDQLIVTGTAALRGDLGDYHLNVSLTNNYTPSGGESYTILDGTTTGGFTTTNLPSLPAGLDWEVVTGSVVLNVIPGIDGDFDDDGDYDCEDVNALTSAVAHGGSVSQFDLNGDNVLSIADVDVWRAEAGEVNLGPGQVYLPSDANLDGYVDGQDFIAWNTHKFTSTSAWCSGDFNADGFVDGQDFIIWNDNKFQSSDVPAQPMFHPTHDFIDTVEVQLKARNPWQPVGRSQPNTSVLIRQIDAVFAGLRRRDDRADKQTQMDVFNALIEDSQVKSYVGDAVTTD